MTIYQTKNQFINHHKFFDKGNGVDRGEWKLLATVYSMKQKIVCQFESQPICTAIFSKAFDSGFRLLHCSV